MSELPSTSPAHRLGIGPEAGYLLVAVNRPGDQQPVDAPGEIEQLDAEQAPAVVLQSEQQNKQPALVEQAQAIIMDQHPLLQAYTMTFADIATTRQALQQGATISEQRGIEAENIQAGHSRDSQEISRNSQRGLETHAANQKLYDSYRAEIQQYHIGTAELSKIGITGVRRELDLLGAAIMDELQPLNDEMRDTIGLLESYDRELDQIGQRLYVADQTKDEATTAYRVARNKLQLVKERFLSECETKKSHIRADFERQRNSDEQTERDQAQQTAQERGGDFSILLDHEEPDHQYVTVAETQLTTATNIMEEAQRRYDELEAMGNKIRANKLAAQAKIEHIRLQTTPKMTRFAAIKKLTEEQIKPLEQELAADLRTFDLLSGQLSDAFLLSRQACASPETTDEERDLSYRFTLALPPYDNRRRQLSDIQDTIAAMREDYTDYVAAGDEPLATAEPTLPTAVVDEPEEVVLVVDNVPAQPLSIGAWQN